MSPIEYYFFKALDVFAVVSLLVLFTTVISLLLDHYPNKAQLWRRLGLLLLLYVPVLAAIVRHDLDPEWMLRVALYKHDTHELAHLALDYPDARSAVKARQVLKTELRSRLTAANMGVKGTLIGRLLEDVDSSPVPILQVVCSISYSAHLSLSHGDSLARDLAVLVQDSLSQRIQELVEPLPADWLKPSIADTFTSMPRIMIAFQLDPSGSYQWAGSRVNFEGLCLRQVQLAYDPPSGRRPSEILTIPDLFPPMQPRWTGTTRNDASGGRWVLFQNLAGMLADTVESRVTCTVYGRGP